MLFWVTPRIVGSLYLQVCAASRNVLFWVMALSRFVSYLQLLFWVMASSRFVSYLQLLFWIMALSRFVAYLQVLLWVMTPSILVDNYESR
jgi:hypothetical protein